MKKYIGNAIQGIAGFGAMLALWCVGAFSYNYTFCNLDIEANSIYYFLPGIALATMFCLILFFGFIGKTKDMKVLYFSAVIGVWLPVLSYICSCIFSNDGNIICWIYGFSLGLLLHPFHRLAWSAFGGVWLGDFALDSDFCAGLLIVGIVLSYIIFRFVNNNKRNNMKKG